MEVCACTKAKPVVNRRFIRADMIIYVWRRYLNSQACLDIAVNIPKALPRQEIANHLAGERAYFMASLRVLRYSMRNRG